MFWAGFGLAILGGWLAPAAGAVLFMIAFAAGLLFYFTLYGVWTQESGIPAWRMMLPGFSRARMRVGRHIFDLLRPSWIKHTLAQTGWPPRPVGLGLLAMLVMDVVIFAAIAPRLTSS